MPCDRVSPTSLTPVRTTRYGGVMKTVPFGTSSAPAVVAGMMHIKDKEDAQIRELYGAARGVGIDFFDHADIYGGRMHACEQRFAEALKLSPAERDEITIQTKCGIVPQDGAFDFSYEHILSEVDGSLRALDTDRIDVLLLHRPDALVEPQEVARAFDELAASGKVRAFGVSNHALRQIDSLRTAVQQQRHHSAGMVADAGGGTCGNLHRQPGISRAERRPRAIRRSARSHPDKYRGRLDHTARREHAGGDGHDEPPDPTSRSLGPRGRLGSGIHNRRQP